VRESGAVGVRSYSRDGPKGRRNGKKRTDPPQGEGINETHETGKKNRENDADEGVVRTENVHSNKKNREKVENDVKQHVTIGREEINGAPGPGQEKSCRQGHILTSRSDGIGAARAEKRGTSPTTSTSRAEKQDPSTAIRKLKWMGTTKSRAA